MQPTWIRMIVYVIIIAMVVTTLITGTLITFF
ncbi:MAG: stressosome-associated protein Prli42 [Firmicutes bacterium]|nr:stressosome-associated protein Prli42 [Melghirimyces thermohalophilus]MDA8352712.1 stressosome-associated protein Prli42 [Bacillota bacterium]